MNFSDYFPQSAGLIKYENTHNQLVAIAKNFEVHVLETATLRLLLKYQFTDVVSHLEWAPDGEFILIGVAKRGQAFVKKIADPEWQCKIDEGLAGLNSCTWAPDSRHVLTVSEFNLRLTAWSMVDKSVQYIEYPKKSGNDPAGQGRGLAFSRDGRIMVLLEKNAEDSRDMVGLYDVGSQWHCMHRFFPETFDASDVMFGQDNNHLIVWESALKQAIHVYQLVYTGNAVSDIRMIAKIAPLQKPQLGLRMLMLTPNDQYLLGGYCDGKMRLISTLSWRESFAFDHASTLDEINDTNSTPELNIYVESENGDDGPLYEAVSKPYKVEKLSQADMAAMKDGLPRVGVSRIVVSHCSQYAATVCESCPNHVWIWDLQRLCLNSLIVQKKWVSDVCWAPGTLNLNISSNDGKIFLWSLRGASVCQVPAMSSKENFKVSQVLWNGSGKSFAAVEQNQGLVFVYPQLQFFNIE